MLAKLLFPCNCYICQLQFKNSKKLDLAEAEKVASICNRCYLSMLTMNDEVVEEKTILSAPFLIIPRLRSCVFSCGRPSPHHTGVSTSKYRATLEIEKQPCIISLHTLRSKVKGHITPRCLLVWGQSGPPL